MSVNSRLQRMKEACPMNVPFGPEGNYRVKVLATLKQIDPHDSQAIAAMILGLIERETAVMLDRVHAVNPKGGDDGE